MRNNINARAASYKLPLLRGSVPVAASLCILWLLRDQLIHLDVAVITQTAFQFTTLQWAVAAGLTTTSFYAIAQYDRLVSAEMALNTPRRDSLHAGWRATAIGQVLGYGLVSGALTRWRALGRPYGLSLWDCSRLTAGVTTSFFLGWAAVASIVVLLFADESLNGWPKVLACIGCLATCGAIGLSVCAPHALAGRLPALRLALPVIGYTALDTLTACLIIYLLLPEGYVPFFTLYSVFLIALVAGMVSGLPGGIGAFELCLATLLAPTDVAPLFAAVIAFRIIYYAAPAALAGLTLIPTPQPFKGRPHQHKINHTLTAELMSEAPPETALVVQGHLKIRTAGDGQSAALWHRGRNCDLVLGDPFGMMQSDGVLTEMVNDARAAGRGLCFYKCSDAFAATSRGSGLRSISIGSEAIVKTSLFNLNGSERRQLRRKLRKAEKAGLTVSSDLPDQKDLERIDKAWQCKNGHAQGFSMGCFNARLIDRQKVFVALKDNKPVAFITILTGQKKWVLDLIRTDIDCPEGATHALVHAAILAARESGVPTFSLAAAPGYLQKYEGCSGHVIRYLFERNRHLKGLTQFKASFAPEWHVLSMAATSWGAMGFAALDLFHLINKPRMGSETPAQPAHNDYAFYEFDSH